MATLLEELEIECNNLSTKTRFEYATLEEANANIFDKLTSGDFPVLLCLPFDINDKRENGRVTSTAEINAIFLDRYTSKETIDVITKEVENQFIAPMRSLAREWVNRLDDNDIINGEGITDDVHRSTHEALMDAHLFGDWLVFTIEFEEGLSLCPPHD